MSKKLVCTVFNVEHGFCAFIKSPNGYGLLIDCGSRPNFSPVKWLRRQYNTNTSGRFCYFGKNRIAECIISHIHADHFDDIGMLSKDRPKLLTRDKKTLKYIEKKIKEAEKKNKNKKVSVLKKFRKFSDEFNKKSEKQPEWGFGYFGKYQLGFDEAQKIADDREKIINNRSYIVGIEYAGKKLLFPGDIEVPGWEKAFGAEKFKEVVQNVDFFITSHHGHKSGFTSEILDYTGIPEIYIVSAKSGDEKVDSSYSKEEYSKGYIIAGRSYKSHMVSTREENKSIEITINENGTSSILLVDAEDNLSDDQSQKRSKKTERMTRGWSR